MLQSLNVSFFLFTLWFTFTHAPCYQRKFSIMKISVNLNKFRDEFSVTSLPLTYPSNLHSHRLWMICCMPNEEHGNRWIQKLDSCGVLLPPAWSRQGQCSFAFKNKVRVRLTRASLHRPDWPLHTGLTLLKHRIRASALPSIYMDSYKAEADILQCLV